MKLPNTLVLGLLLAALPAGIVSAETVWLDDLDLSVTTQGWGVPQKNQSVGGHALAIGGQKFERGFGTHATSSLRINLASDAKSFAASVGVDDEVNGEAASSVEFIVLGDGRPLWRSDVMHAKDAAKTCMVDLTGVKTLVLEVTDAGDGNAGDHADWADAKFEMTTGKPVTASEPEPVVPVVSAGTVWLDDLNLSAATQGWGVPHKNYSVGGHPLAIGGQQFKRGFGTHAISSLQLNLAGGAKSFSADVGVDDDVNGDSRSSVEFIVAGDGKTLWQSGVMHASEPAKTCTVDLTGVKTMVLQVSDAGDGNVSDHADWANAKFEMTAGKPVTVSGAVTPIDPPSHP